MEIQLALTEFTAPNLTKISKRMGAPKLMTMEAWFRQARKMVPEIPNPKQSDWQITFQSADRQWIKFEMHNSIGERCFILIDRLQPFIGAK